jgi:hypothetical protein
MRSYINLRICLVIVLVAVGYAHASQVLIPVVSQGETFVTSATGKIKVQVKIITHEVQIGKPSDRGHSGIESSCTYSKYPCSIVDRIEITVDSNSLFIPRSIFCDLADLNRAEVKTGQKIATLTLYGGDASESYVVNIEFDADGVKRRILLSAMFPDQPLQETIYYVRVLGD